MQHLQLRVSVNKWQVNYGKLAVASVITLRISKRITSYSIIHSIRPHLVRKRHSRRTEFKLKLIRIIYIGFLSSICVLEIFDNGGV